jgi:hypothetical protein
MAVLANLQTAVENYSTALVSDSVNPQPSYQLDGQMVSRQEWREGLLRIIKELNATINALNPYQIDTKQVL